MRHILTGYDHVLFLLCLLLPSVMRRARRAAGSRSSGSAQAVWPVAGIVTAFTVAHSITLGLAALKLVSLSPAFIEPAIAVDDRAGRARQRRCRSFRCAASSSRSSSASIHGFGFAGVLAELDLPRADFAWALFQFNLGLEAGQLVIVARRDGVLFGLRRWRGYPTVVIGGGSALAIAIGVLWLDRAHGQRLDPAVLSVARLQSSDQHPQERERHDGYDTANYHPRPEGVGRRASPHPIVFRSNEKRGSVRAFSLLGVCS